MSVQIEGEKSRRKDWNVVNDFERTKQKEQLIYGHDYDSHISFNTLHTHTLSLSLFEVYSRVCVCSSAPSSRPSLEMCGVFRANSRTYHTYDEWDWREEEEREAFMSGRISGSTSENNSQIWRKLNHKFLISIFVMIITSLWPFASLFVSIFMNCFFSFSLAESILHF